MVSKSRINTLRVLAHEVKPTSVRDLRKSMQERHELFVDTTLLELSVAFLMFVEELDDGAKTQALVLESKRLFKILPPYAKALLEVLPCN